MELGGEGDTIHDTEKLRDELISVAYGIWDFVKNSGEYNADNWELEFVGFLPGKRESRRYVGDYIMNQNDVRDGGHFDDIAAYGGWTMDDHNPAGINTKDKLIYFILHLHRLEYLTDVYIRSISKIFILQAEISVLRILQ